MGCSWLRQGHGATRSASTPPAPTHVFVAPAVCRAMGGAPSPQQPQELGVQTPTQAQGSVRSHCCSQGTGRGEEGAYLGWDRPSSSPPLHSPPATPCKPGTASTAWRELPQLPSASSRLRTSLWPTGPPPSRLSGPPPRVPAASLGSPGFRSPPAAAAGRQPAPGGTGACSGPWLWMPRWDPVLLDPSGSRPASNGWSRDLTSWPPANGVVLGEAAGWRHHHTSQGPATPPHGPCPAPRSPQHGTGLGMAPPPSATQQNQPLGLSQLRLLPPSAQKAPKGAQ